MRDSRTLAGLTLAAGGTLFIALWLEYRDFWLDDAFITFRYARNWADGLGPVFNPGEYVEGYTTFLWTLLVAGAFAVLPGGAVLPGVKLAGLGLGLFVLWRGYTFPGPDGRPRRRWLMGLLAANPIFVANCGDGMETPLLMALLLECARACAAEPTRRNGALAGLLTAACVWTRPEAMPLLAGLPAVLLFFHRSKLHAALAWTRTFALAAGIPVLAHLGFRLWYYGALLPNSFYAKATGEIPARLANGVADVAGFASSDHGVPALGVWIALGLAGVGLRGRDGAGKWLTLLWGMLGFRLAFDVWSGSESMGTFRFLAPLLPPLFVLADEGARSLARPATRRTVAALAAIALAVSIWGNLRLSDARDRYAAGLERAHMALGSWLAQTQPEGTWIALGDAGAVPFVSGLPTIDLWGLADAHIARLPGEYGDRPGTADYVLERRPAVLVLWNVVPIHGEPGRLRIVGAWPFDREIAEHPVFAREYRFAREFTFRPESRAAAGYYLDVFQHRPAAKRR